MDASPRENGSLAQLVERLTLNQNVVGSNPTGSTSPLLLFKTDMVQQPFVRRYVDCGIARP